ncbi:hypothetical protein scyTo_0018519, partial [Scyliorhinus torazame]|nr:hypothetical protein [Scyliorhinus torazame]
AVGHSEGTNIQTHSLIAQGVDQLDNNKLNNPKKEDISMVKVYVSVGVVLFVVLSLLLIGVAMYVVKKKKIFLGKVMFVSKGERTMEGEEVSESLGNDFVGANISNARGQVPKSSSLESPVTSTDQPANVLYSTVEFKAENRPVSTQPPAEEVEYATIAIKAK